MTTKRKSSNSVTKGLITTAMEDWFRQATPEERDALSALQLDYRFTGDNLGSMWWPILQDLGFTHNKTTYELPKSAPTPIQGNYYTALELYEKLDQFAIPHLSSPFDEFPMELPLGNLRSQYWTMQEKEEKEENENEHTQQYDEQNWWRTIRDEMIFRKFHMDVEGFQLEATPANQDHHNATDKSNTTSTKITKKRTRRLWNGSDVDGSLGAFTKKPKRGKTSSSMKRGQDSFWNDNLNIVFPTLDEYACHVQDESFDVSQVEETENDIAMSFSKWKFQLIMNHSLLFHGAGSKRNLLNRFAKELQVDGYTLTIDGFHKDVTIEGILDLIDVVWLDGGPQTTSHHHHHHHRFHVHLRTEPTLAPSVSYIYPQRGDVAVVERAISMAKALAGNVSKSKIPYHLVLHNIDGTGLRNPTAQEALSALVSQSVVMPRGLNALRLVASFDHVNAPALLWDSLTLARFRWKWKEVHTNRPYLDELKDGKPILLENQAKDLAVEEAVGKSQDSNTSYFDSRASIFSVLSSLAPRHADSLKVLASLQAAQLLKEGKQQQQQESCWVAYRDLLRKVLHQCIVKGDQQLRYIMKELCDHGVVKQRSTSISRSSADHGTLAYQIPYNPKILKQIMEYSYKSSNAG